MTNYTATIAKHATLAAGVVDTVTLSNDYDSVEVFNRGGGEIYFTTNGTVPTVGGDNTRVVASGSALQSYGGGYGDGVTVVNLISSGATAYSVTGLRN
jgi:hypothetical protein